MDAAALSGSPAMIVETARKSPIPVTIQPYGEGDLRHVEFVEQLAFCQHAWKRQQLKNMIEREGCSCILALTPALAVAGFMMFRRTNGHVFLANIAVHPGRQRQEVGTQMIDWLKDHMRQIARRTWTIEAQVDEQAPWAVTASRFLCSQGIKGLGLCGVRKDHWRFACTPTTREDGYVEEEASC